MILLERDELGELHTVELRVAIALARCPRCGTRPRVLPCDVLPRKQYSLAVITEKPEMFGRTLIYLGLAEGIAIYGLVVSILLLGRI